MRVAAIDFMWADELRKLLDPSAVTLEVLTQPTPSSRDAALAEAEVLISARFSASMGRAARQLKLLLCPAAGTERIDRDALPDGTRVVNASGHEYPMAEYVLGCLVVLRQRIMESDMGLRRGEWRYGFNGTMKVVDELYGTRLGLIGFGRIGREVAARATAFGMRTSAVTLHPEYHRNEGILESLGRLTQAGDVDALLRASDQLVVCCELSAITEGFMNARRFELMKPTAVLVNIARGPIVVEADLFAALESRRIAGAAIDVWYQYPKDDMPLCKPSVLPFERLDNIIMTPHSSGWSEQAKRRRLTAMAEVINDYARAQRDSQGTLAQHSPRP